MMLRSASTPSLVSSLSKSPAAPAAAYGQVSCNSHAGFQGVAKSLVSSPSHLAEIMDADSTEIRRAQSAGNLEEVFTVPFFHVADHDEYSLSRQSSRRLSRMNTLEAISSLYPDNDYDDDDVAEEEEEDEAEGNLKLFTVQNLATHEVRRELTGFCDVGFPGEGKMYLAAGIGVNSISFLDDSGFGGCGGGGGSYRPGENDRDGGDNRGLSMENHYKNMLMQDPGNPLFLRNYAHFLYQVKGDLVGAEEYYSRAILTDPEDGEILCQYGRVIWELHHDKERARFYFQRAVQASSGESNISASYASFLWDIEDGEDEDEDDDVVKGDAECINPRLGERFLIPGIMASATA